MNAARSRFASSSTMAAALPPSSSSTGLTYRPASDATTAPMCVLPVKLILRTAGCAMSASVTAGASVTLWYSTCRQPSGRPAWRKMSPSAQKHLGESSEPLRMAVLPAASGSSTARVPRMNGAFHGAMPRITPYGSLNTRAPSPCSDTDGTAPSMDGMRAAKSLMKAAPISNVFSANGRCDPVSSIWYAISSSRRDSMMSAAFRRMSRRAFGVVLLHAGNAALAESTARRASSTDAPAHRCATCPVAGL